MNIKDYLEITGKILLFMLVFPAGLPLILAGYCLVQLYKNPLLIKNGFWWAGSVVGWIGSFGLSFPFYIGVLESITR